MARGDDTIRLVAIAGLGAFVAWRYLQSQGATVDVKALTPQGRIATVPGSVVQKPMGIRNNNPGNIRPGAGFKGETGSNAGYAVFDTPENGVRAMFKLLQTYINKYGLNTIAKIGSRWAPPNENKTSDWVANVAKYSGLSANAALTANNYSQLARVAVGIISAENGGQYAGYYPASLFPKAWAAI